MRWCNGVLYDDVEYSTCCAIIFPLSVTNLRISVSRVSRVSIRMHDNVSLYLQKSQVSDNLATSRIYGLFVWRIEILPSIVTENIQDYALIFLRLLQCIFQLTEHANFISNGREIPIISSGN